MVDVRYASEAAPGQANEDRVIAGDGWVVVLDGATCRPGVDTGCAHGVRWLAGRLAGELARRLAPGSSLPLPDLLAEAIAGTCRAHAGTCDLTNPDSPSAAVALLRRQDDRVEWLVLADSPVLMDVNGHLEVALDDRPSRLPSYTVEAVRTLRNTPAGFWVAGTLPEAAHEALTGSADARQVRRAAVLTDGATRLVERFSVLDWPSLLDALDHEGPTELIRRTRQAEHAETAAERATRRGKPHDDATAVIARFP